MHLTVSASLIAVTFEGIGFCAGKGARSIGAGGLESIRGVLRPGELSPSIEGAAVLSAESSCLSLALSRWLREPKSARASGMHTSKTAATAMYAMRWGGELISLSKRKRSKVANLSK